MICSAREHGYDGSFIICSPGATSAGMIDGVLNEMDLSIPDHGSVPYGFKPWLIYEAFSRGHNQVLWVDSTVVFNGPTTDLFKMLDEVPVLAFDNPGCPIPFWTNDRTMAELNWDPTDLRFEVMACVLGFNFANEQTMPLFREWQRAADAGLFNVGERSLRPEFRDHRHDQSVISILIHRAGIPLVPYGTLTYWTDRNANTLISNRGIGQH